jgi:hypothetical protein
MGDVGEVESDGDKRPDASELARELARRWLPILIGKSWPERFDLIRQMHEQMQDDLVDLQLYAEVSPYLIQKIIEGLAGGPIESPEQAQIYANSAEAAHREAAGAWLARHHKPKTSPRK